jgi:hypothetical protein
LVGGEVVLERQININVFALLLDRRESDNDVCHIVITEFRSLASKVPEFHLSIEFITTKEHKQINRI